MIQINRKKWKSRLFSAVLAIVVIIGLCSPAFAASDPCNGNHSYPMYYNEILGKTVETDCCQNCDHVRVHPCRHSLRFMTVGKTNSYAKPWESSPSKLLSNSSKHTVIVTGRVRNQDGKMWLQLNSGAYIPAESVAFNFDYIAENAAKNTSDWIIREVGMLLTFGLKDYNVKNDDLLGNTYLYQLYSFGTILPERYTGEQIGNMIYGYVSAAKKFSPLETLKNADTVSGGADSPEDKASTLLGYNYRKNGAWYKDVSNQYVGKTVAIKSVEVGKYVSSDTDRDVQGINAVANRDKIGTWELYSVDSGDGGAVGFRSIGNGNYLSARIDENEENAYIQAAFGQNYSKPQSWESFHIFEWGDNLYIQSLANGKWVQVSVNETNCPMKATADVPSTWERFHLVITSD